MYELARDIPDQQMLLAMAPEELGAKMLLLMRKRSERSFRLGNFEEELFRPFQSNQAYYSGRKEDISLALAEAWAWLGAQGLIIPEPGPNRQNGWQMLSRRARKMESATEFAHFTIARLLPKEILHPKIADAVWSAFMRGEFDGAVFQAMKGVEVAVREASGLGNDLVGVALMRKAFAPQDGPLTDMTGEGGERQGRVELFSSAMASYKNPHSHRDVNLEDPQEALEIIFFANHLLRIVDARAKARAGATP